MSASATGGAESRIKDFKNKGKDIEDLRRRRNEVTVQLRKDKKEEILTKRRNICTTDDSPVKQRTSDPKLTFEDICDGLYTEDINRVLMATKAARKMLSCEQNPPIDIFVEIGAVPRLVSFLSNQVLQFEASWVLTNIASGTANHTQTVVEAGALPHFVNLLYSSDRDVVDQAVWAIGNIAGDGPVLRDQVISSGAVDPLTRLATSPQVDETLLRRVSWTISNLCRGHCPPTSIEVVRHILPALAKLTESKDVEVLADTCRSLAYITDGSVEKTQMVIFTGVIANIVSLLRKDDFRVVEAALRCLCNIVAGSNDQADVVINSGALSHMQNLLRHKQSDIVKDAAWMVANILAANPDQIRYAIDDGIAKPLVDVFIKGDFKCQKEAAWAIFNLSAGGTPRQVVDLCKTGLLSSLNPLLRAEDNHFILVLLKTIAYILAAADSLNETKAVTEMMLQNGVVSALESFYLHSNQEIFRKAAHLMDTYFQEHNYLVSTLRHINGLPMRQPIAQGYRYIALDFQDANLDYESMLDYESLRNVRMINF